MLVVNRFRVPDEAADAFREDCSGAGAARRAARLPRRHIGRNVDDPELWVLTTRWVHVGAYRRALSSYDVKVRRGALLSRALDEPSAYESSSRGTALNIGSTRSLG